MSISPEPELDDIMLSNNEMNNGTNNGMNNAPNIQLPAIGQYKVTNPAGKLFHYAGTDPEMNENLVIVPKDKVVTVTNTQDTQTSRVGIINAVNNNDRTRISVPKSQTNLMQYIAGGRRKSRRRKQRKQRKSRKARKARRRN